MTRFGMALFTLSIPAAFAGAPAAAATAPVYEIQRHVVRGVYWPWERTALHARLAGMEFWEFVDQLMGRVREDWHCNLVWFVNGPSDPARACDLAAKHGLLVVSGTRLAGLFVHGLRGEEQLDAAVRRTVAEIGNKSSLGAYALKDEPKCIEKAQMETYRLALEAADPVHPSIVVTMTSHTEPYATDTGFPVICTDIYHFGGDRSPAIPNPARRSRATFRQCVTALTTMAGAHGKTAWNMPQAFADVWGASWLDDQGNVVLEPGSYWHWRMPTVAETRWQIWESIRAGCKGVVFFAILLGGKDEWTPEQGAMPKAMQDAIARNKGKWPMVRTRLSTGQPRCLTRNGGTSTPQAEAMAEAFAALARQEALIVRWRPARIPFAFADAPGAVQSFRDPADSKLRYAVVVNDATEQAAPAEIRLRFPPNVEVATDLASGQSLALRPEPVGNEQLKVGVLRLPPGGGTVLELSFRNGRPGLLLYDEDFSKLTVTATLEHAVRRRESRGFGMGGEWRVRKDGNEDAPGLIVLDGLQTHKFGPGSRLCTALRDVAKGRAMVYFLLDGYCPRPESLVVQLVDKEGKAGWNKTDAFHLPLAVPKDIDAVRIRVAPGAYVRRVRFWRVAVPPVGKGD